MQAIIFAAGKSTRTMPLTRLRPKPLLKVMDQSILEHNLDQLQDIVDEAIIIIGYKGDMIRELGDKYGNISLTYIVQEEQKGNGDALMLAKDNLKDKFIVMNGDDFFSGKDIKNCTKHKYCVLVKEVDDLSRFGQVIVENHKVTGFKEKPGNMPGLASTGLLVMDMGIFEYELRKSKRGEYEVVDFIRYLVEDSEVNFEFVSDYWLPITYPWNLLEANEFFLKKTKGRISGNVEEGATLKGEIVVEEGAVIRSGSYIQGPCYIGKGCMIGPNCYIRPYTSLHEGVHIGNACEIKNSVVGDNSRISHLSYIGDSIIGTGANIGAGTITANLRHDEKNIHVPVNGKKVDTQRKKLGAMIADQVHTGIHTSIYPGRKVTKDTLPGEIVK